MRIGVFGGTFNPLHIGHVRAAQYVVKEYRLDLCYLMVANDPPHKPVACGVTALQRFEMTAAAMSGSCKYDKVRVSDMELKLEGISYTVNTMRELRKQHASADIFLIIGEDMLFSIDRWYMPEEIFKLCGLIVLRRETGHSGKEVRARAREIKVRFGANGTIARFIIPNISSSEVRECVRAAKPVSDYVPQEIEQYIYENCLYQGEPYTKIFNDLKERVDTERLHHCANTVRSAIHLANKYGADSRRCALAALLHDCGKVRGSDYVELAESLGLEVTDYERSAPALLHAKIGAYYARERYGIDDEDILNAIRYHTICRENMSDIEKIVYIADKIEPTRCFEGVKKLRESADISLDKGMIVCIDFGRAHIIERNLTIHPDTERAREYILDLHKN